MYQVQKPVTKETRMIFKRDRRREIDAVIDYFGGSRTLLRSHLDRLSERPAGASLLVTGSLAPQRTRPSDSLKDRAAGTSSEEDSCVSQSVSHLRPRE